MNQQTTPPVVDRSPRTLSLVCLAHMQQEEAMLAETIESLRHIQAALRGGNLSSLRQALDRQAHVARASQELRDRRAGLRREIAAMLGTTPDAVTLSALATHLQGDARSRLAHCRERLAAMAADVERLNQANARLVGHSLDFLERFLVEITGGDTAGPRYGPAGTTHETAVGSMLETQG